MKLAAFLLVSAAAAFGAIEGTVVNATTGKPQAGAAVTLINLGGGMANAGTVKTDDKGAFRFDVEAQPNSPYLVQAMHQGVTYNRMLQPGEAAGRMLIEVYDAAAKAPDAKVAQHMILLEPSAENIVVNQTVVFNNAGKTTYQDPNGTLRFTVPAQVTGPVQVRISAPQGMPINRQAEKTSDPGVYAVRYPIKPGETRIDILYAVPPGSKFAGKILHGGGPVRFVAPQGVTLESPSLTSLGAEPQTNASIFELKGSEYEIAVQGTGMLQAQGAQPAAGGEGGGEGEGSGIDVAKPRIYDRAPYIMALTFLMLAVGFVMLYRAGAEKRG